MANSTALMSLFIGGLIGGTAAAQDRSYNLYGVPGLIDTPNARTALRFQRVAATQASNFSAGVWYCKVFLGRSFSWRATALSLAWLNPDISVLLGKYCLRRRLVFSLLPRCHGD